MSDIIYNNVRKNLENGTIKLDADTFMICLLTSDYTPAATHQVYSDLDSEVEGEGYTEGGKALTTLSLTETGGVATWTAANPSWPNSTITARYAVIYDAAAGNKLIKCFDFVTDKSDTNGTFTVQFNAAGILVAA